MTRTSPETHNHREVDMAAELMVPGKARERVETSGLMEPGETVKAYVEGRPLLVPAFLRPRFVFRDTRAVVLTDRHLYVFDMRRRGEGAVKSVRTKYPLGAVEPDLGSPTSGWRFLLVGDDSIWVADHGWPLAAAEAIVAAGQHITDRPAKPRS
jgi:hypothetical protein